MFKTTPDNPNLEPITIEQYIAWIEQVKVDLEALETASSNVNQSAILTLESCITLAGRVETNKEEE